MIPLDKIMKSTVSVTLPIKSLKNAPYNPRKKLKPVDAEYQQIKKSILTYGFVSDIVINQDNMIIGGHQRVQVLKDLGIETVPCKQVNLDDLTCRALCLALNKIDGKWDYDALALSLSVLDENEFDIASTGFTDAELDALTRGMDSGLTEALADDEDAKKEDDKAKIKMIYLSIGKDRVPMSGVERDAMVSLLSDYVDEYDSPIGFVSWLLKKIE